MAATSSPFDVLTPTMTSLSISSSIQLVPTTPRTSSGSSSGHEVQRVILQRRPTSAAASFPSPSENGKDEAEADRSQDHISSQQTQGQGATHAPENAGLDETIVRALEVQKDRIFLSKVDAELERFTLDASQSRLPIAPPHFGGSLNAYQRLLLHRLADSYGIKREKDSLEARLDGSVTGPVNEKNSYLVLIKTEQTAIPAFRISALISMLEKEESTRLTESPFSTSLAITDQAPTFKIMSRQSAQQSPSASAPQSMYNGEGSERSSSTGKPRPALTLEEREAAYREARNRIFKDSDSLTASLAAEVERPSSRTSSSDKSRTSGGSGSVLEGSSTTSVNSSMTTTRSASGSPTTSTSSVKTGNVPGMEKYFKTPPAIPTPLYQQPTLRAGAPVFDPSLQYGSSSFYHHMPYAAQQQQPIYPPPHIPPQVQGVAPLRHYNHHTAPQEYNQHAPPQGYNRDVSPPHYPPVPPPHPSSSSPQAPNLYGPYYMDSTTGQMIPFAPQTFPPQHQPSQQQPQHMPIQRTAQVVPAPALQWEHRPYAQAVLYDGGSRQESERPQPPQMISPHPIYPHSQPLHGKQNELQPTPAATSSFQSPALSPVSTLSNHNQGFASHAPSSGLPLRFSGPPVATSIMNGPPDNHLPYTHRPASSASVSSSSTSRTASSSNRPGGSSISGSSSSVSISGLELLPMRATSKYPRKKVKPMKEEKTSSSATQNGGADEKETSLITNPPFLPAKPTWVEQEPSLPPKKESKRRMPGNLPPLASNGRQPHSEPNILYQPFGPQPHNHAPNAVGMPMPNFAPPLPMYYNTFQQQQQVQLGCEVDNPPRRSESGRKLWEPRQMS